jgi:hypothetical protein
VDTTPAHHLRPGYELTGYTHCTPYLVSFLGNHWQDLTAGLPKDKIIEPSRLLDVDLIIRGKILEQATRELIDALMADFFGER